MDKTARLFFLLASGVALLGTLFQINPVWLYEPYDPAAVTTGAQPNWWTGWLEGALRLMPSFEVIVFGYEIPNVFFPGGLLAACRCPCGSGRVPFEAPAAAERSGWPWTST